MVKQFQYGKDPVTIEYETPPTGRLPRVTEIHYTDKWQMEIPLDSLLAKKLISYFKNSVLGHADRRRKPQ